MIKQKGDKAVQDWVHDRSGFSTMIYLRDTKFVATLLEREFDAPDISILKRKLADYAAHWLEMEWFPVIKVKVKQADDKYGSKSDTEDHQGVEFERERFYLSRSPVGELWFSKWETEPEHRKAQMEAYFRSDGDRAIKLTGLPLGAPLKLKGGYREEGGHLIDYTEELWDRLTGIINNIKFLRKQLELMVASKAGVQTLLAVTAGDRIDPGALMLENNKAK